MGKVYLPDNNWQKRTRDTAFAAYVSRRLTDVPREALKSAASLVSIEMESPGFFKGTMTDVKRRMRKDERT